MVNLTDVPLGKDHPLALELTGLRTAVARFQVSYILLNDV